MEEDDYVVTVGIDTSESIVTTQKLDIDYLKEENHFLKRNLQANVDKLNDALKAVDLMQNMLVTTGHLHESRKIHIETLEKPRDFHTSPNEASHPNPSSL